MTILMVKLALAAGVIVALTWGALNFYGKRYSKIAEMNLAAWAILTVIPGWFLLQYLSYFVPSNVDREGLFGLWMLAGILVASPITIVAIARGSYLWRKLSQTNQDISTLKVSISKNFPASK